jgi:hypothetical protein
MDNEIECVNDFLKNPTALTQMEVNYNSNWSDYLTLLHILLVKNNIKKNHIILNESNKKKINKSHNQLSKKLNFSPNLKSIPHSMTLVYETGFFNHEIIEELALATFNSVIMIIYAKDEILLNDQTNLNSKSVGKLLEYPHCCINWLIETKINDFEIGFAILNRLEMISPQETLGALAQKIVKIHSDDTQPDILYRLSKIWKNQFSIGRKKFPFCFHQPCDECLGDDKSPSALLNEKYAKFAQTNFPKLYEKIILESQIIAKEYDEDVKSATTNLTNIGYNPDDSEILTQITPIDILD